MFGRTRLSTMREVLRKALAAEAGNPIDSKVRDLKSVKSGKDKVLKELEAFCKALAKAVEESEQPVRSKRGRTAKKRFS